MHTPSHGVLPAGPARRGAPPSCRPPENGGIRAASGCLLPSAIHLGIASGSALALRHGSAAWRASGSCSWALGRGLHDPARLAQQVSPARRRARASQPPRRPPHPRSARAASRDVRPRPRSGQLADACRSRVLVSSSLQGGAGPAREGDRPLRSGGGELTTGPRPSASYRGERGSSGSPSGRGGKPDGDTGPAAAGADSGVFPGACRPGTTSAHTPARSACWRHSHNRRTAENRSAGN